MAPENKTPLSLAELEKVWSYGEPPLPLVNSTICQLIQVNFKAHPDATALSTTWQGEVTYNELDELTANLATFLLESVLANSGSGTEDEDHEKQAEPLLIPILFEKSIWAVVAMIAILRAGAAFVPLDPKQPTARRGTVLARANAKFVLTSEECAPIMDKDAARNRTVVIVGKSLADELSSKYCQLERGGFSQLSAPHLSVETSATAYVMFTSGSTGEPKGVIVDHATAASSCLALGARLGMGQGTRVVQFSAYTFDACIFEILGTLIWGGTVCILSEDERVNSLAKAITALKAEVFVPLTPTVARSMTASEVPHLHTVCLGGEAVTQADIDRWADVPHLLNVYGPTETCIICIANNIKQDESNGLVLGQAFASTTWVVDPEDHDVLVRPGHVGELLVEGILATGYLGQPELTAKAFVDNPPWLVAGSTSRQGRKGRVYKTGDLVRHHPDGSGRLVFVGRKDSQVKIRGNRIELEDVEHHLRDCLPVSAAVAELITPTPGACDSAGSTRQILAGFLLGYETGLRNEAKSSHEHLHFPLQQVKLSTQEASSLRQRLSDPMVPSVFFRTGHLPTTSSGKLDRKLLRALGSQAMDDEPCLDMVASKGKDEIETLETKHIDAHSLNRIWQLNQDPPPKPPTAATCLHHLFEKQAEMTPESTAICGWDGDFTYSELNRASSIFASHLSALGVGPNTAVPMIFETSSWAVVAILAILKVGATFVGIDGRQLPERRNEMVERVHANVVLVSEDLAPTVSKSLQVKYVVTVSSKTLHRLIKSGLDRFNSQDVVGRSDAVCYIIFTSGTTGIPKGVMTEHGAICTSVLAHIIRMGVDSRSRVLQFSVCSFDACIMEIFPALASGGVVCVPSTTERTDGGLENAVARMNVNFFIVTPSVSRLIKAAVIGRATVVLVGEAASASDLIGWDEQVRLLNGYGPTECSAGCVMHDISQKALGDSNLDIATETRVIGKAVGCVTWVVDLDDPSKLATIDAEGELFIEGSILARGYLDQEQTCQAFINDPIWLLNAPHGYKGRHGRVYKTGDVVRYNSDGSLVYIGRRDSQIKLRGQRVELGDIERHLQILFFETTGVRNIDIDAVVVEMVATPEHSVSRGTLVALFQMSHGKDPAGGRPRLDDDPPALWPFSLSEERLSGISERLPQFMTPSIYLGISRIPTTSAGKTDRRRLRELILSYLSDRQQSPDTGLSSKLMYTRKPSTEVESRLHKIWAQILGLEPGQFGVDCDFLRLGGDSLVAMHLCATARKTGLIISSRDILTKKTIARLALVVRTVQPSSDSPQDYRLSRARKRIRDEETLHCSPFALSPIQKLYFDVNKQLDTKMDQSYYLEMKDTQLTYESLDAAFKAVISMHPMLRVRLVPDEGTWLQRISPSVEESYRLVRSSLSCDESLEDSFDNARASLNIQTGPIVSAVLFESRPQRLFISISHLAVDTVSWQIILKDLTEFLHTKDIPTPPQTSFPTWCKRQAAYVSSRHQVPLPFTVSSPDKFPESYFKYWGLASDDEGSSQDGHAWSTVSFSLDKSDTQKLLTSCNEAYDTEPAMLLVAALVVSFKKIFPDRSLPHLYQEGHGRESWDGELDPWRTVGWFTTVFQIPLDGFKTIPGELKSSDNLCDVVRRAKDAMKHLARKGWFDFTSQMLTTLKDKGTNCLAGLFPVEVMFNYSGVSPTTGSTERLEDGIFSTLPIPDSERLLNKTRLSALIQVEAAVSLGRLQVDVHHNSNMRHHEKLAQWSRSFESTLKEMIPMLEGKQRDWTLVEFPETFASYHDLDRFRKESLPGLALQAEDVEDVFPMTPLQHGMYTGHLKDPGAYMLSFNFECSARDPSTNVTVEQLCAAWALVVQRHPLLRAVIIDALPGTSNPGFVLLRAPQVTVRVEKPSITASKTHVSLGQGRKADLLHKFSVSVEDDRVMKCCLEINHIIFDAHSKSLVLRDLQGFLAGDRWPVAPSFRLFASHLALEDFENTEQYWRTYLDGAEPCLIPTGPRGGTSGKVSVRTETLPGVPWALVKDFCRKHGSVTPANILELAWGWVLRGYTGLSTVCFSHLVSSRGSTVVDAAADEEVDDNEILGPLFGNLPVRIDFESSDTVLKTASIVNQTTLDGLSHQNTSLANIHHVLGIGAGRLSNSCVALEFSTLGLDSVEEGRSPIVINEVSGYDPTDFDVLVSASISENDELQISINYQAELISQNDARYLGETLRHAILWILQNPTSTWDEANLISPAHMAQIVAWNSPIPEITHGLLHQLVEAQVNQRPYSAAIHAWDGELSYMALENAANMIAVALRAEHGVRAGTLVPLIMEKSRWTMVAMLAILKAGGAFVPVAKDPPGRMDRVLSQLPEGTPVVTSQLYASLVGARVKKENLLVVGDQDGSRLVTPSNPTPFSCSPDWAQADAPAYVIFTSGTTGDPKGVVIEHASITTAILAQGRAFGYRSATRSYQFTSYTFDASITEIFATLSNGGCLCIPSETTRLDLDGTAEAIESMHVNTCFFTPTLARLLQPSKLKCVTTLILGGEAVDEGLVAMWSHVPRVFCLYGPSEASICCASYEIRRSGEDDGVKSESMLGVVGCPIGKALASVSWIVDRNDHHKLAPLGAYGELLVDGPIVGKGYLNDDAKTESVFISDPRWMPPRPRSSRMYKTGDLVRYLPDGTLLFQGRKDSQVKINGQRIELGEVEFHVRKVMPFEIASVVAEIVTLSSGGENGSAPAQQGTKKLVVVIGLEDDNGDEGDGHKSDGNFDSPMKPLHLSSEVFAELETRLPIYMVPSIFFAMPKDKIPTSASGKTDRKQLRNLVSSHFSLSALAQVQREANKTVKRQPVTDIQRQLQSIWAEVLGQDPQAIGLDDTFFRVGGTSLTAMTVTRQANHKFSLGVLFSHLVKGLTLAELAAKCDQGNAKQSHQDFITPFSLLDISVDQVSSLRENLATKLGIDESQVEDCFPCTPLQEGLMSMTEQSPGAYVARHVFSLSSDLDLVKFHEAWDVAAQSARILRSRIVYSHQAKAFLQVVVREKTKWMTQSGAHNARDLSVAKNDTSDSMGLGTHLTHYTIVTDEESRQSWLIWTIHHALYDGYSLTLIMDLVTRAYHGLGPGPVQPKSLQCLIQHTKALEPAVVKSWWVSYLSNLSAVHFPGPSNEKPPVNHEGEAKHGTAGFLERIVKIPSESNEISIEGDMAFSTMIHAAWALVISKITGSNDVVFGAMLPGRHHGYGDGLELDNVIGPTLALVPVRIIVNSGQNVRVLLKTLQSQAIGMSKVEQVGIQNLAKFNRDTQFACGFQTLLSVQPAAEELTQIPSAQGLWEWCADTTPVGRGLEEYGLTLQVIIPADNRGDLIVKANFDHELVRIKVMATALDHFVCIMERLVGMRGSLADTTLVSDVLANIDTTGACGLPITVTRPKDLVPTVPPHPEAAHKGRPKTIEDEAVHFDHDRRPSTLVERLLQQLWAEVLGIDPDLISIDDSFVRLGGDSVLAMQLASLARDYHFQITPRDVLGHSKTISSLAILIKDRKKSRKSYTVQRQLRDGAQIPENEAEKTHTIGSRYSSNIDIHQLETVTLPKLGIITNEVEDVFPCSPLQEGIMLSQVSRPEVYWNSLIFDVVSNKSDQMRSLSPDKLHHAWELVVQRHALLRAVLVDALPGRTEPGFIVLKNLLAKVSHLRVPKEIADATCMDVEYFRGLNSGTTATKQAVDQRQHYLTICEVYSEHQVVDRLVVCLYFNHVILDGHSQSVLMSDLRAAYTGIIGLSLAPSYSQFIAHTKGAGSIHAEAEALAHWKRFMKSVEPCILPAEDTDEPAENQIKTLYVCNVPREAVLLFHHNSDATTATLVQTAWAMTLQRLTGLSKVVFGVGSSVRDMLQVPGITEMVGPVISLLLCQADLTDACITAHQLLHQIGSDIQDALPHQNSASLARVLHEMGYNGVRNRLFNTAINLQSPAHNQTSDMHDFDIDIVPRASQDVTEFDVTLSSTDSMDGLHVSMNYKSAYMSSHQASKVSTAIVESISWIIQNLDAPLSEGRPQDSMQPVCVMPLHKALHAAGDHTGTSEPTTPGPTMGPVEAQLQRLFCRALNLPEEQIRVQDDFFRLGGDSVAAIQISSWARSKGLDITVRDIMTRRTIANLATLTPEHPPASTPGTTSQQNVLAKISVSMTFPLAPLQHLYFHIQGPAQPGVAFLGGFDQSILLRLARPFSLSQTTEAFKSLVHLHPMLRARISANSRSSNTGLRTQEITADVDGSYHVRRVPLPLDPEASSRAIACAITEALDNLDAIDGPILTVVLFEGGGLGQQQRMFLAIHHLMVDLVSWRIILRDLEEFLTTGKITVSPTSGYHEWCQSLALSANSKSTGHSPVLRPSQFSYWGVDAGQNIMENMISRSFVIETNLTAKLLGADGSNLAFGTNLPILLIAALISSFRHMFPDRREPVIWNEQVGRDPLKGQDTGALDVSGTVGWFTSLAPVEIDGHRDANIADVVRRVKDCIMTPPTQGWHRWLASEMANGDISSQWPAEIIFNYLGLFQQLERHDALFARDLSSFTTGLSSHESQIKQFSIIDVTASIASDPFQRLEVFVRYNRHVKQSSQVEAWINTLQQTIERMVPILEDIGKKAPQWTLSDFPGVFSRYDDVEEFRLHTVSTVLHIPPDEVEDVLLLSPLQQGIFLSQVKDPESYHTAVFMELSDVANDTAFPIDLDKLTQAWQCVVGKHSLLRALLVESLPGNALPALVVQRNARGTVRHLGQNELASASTQVFRSIGWWRQFYDPIQVYKLGLQHHLTLAEHAGKVYACLEINHMIVDAASTTVLLRDWKLAYERTLDPRVSSYRQLGHMKSIVSQPLEHGKEDTRLLYWRGQLQGLQPCLLPMPGALLPEFNQRQVGSQHSRIVASLQLPSIRTFCSRYGFTVANVMQMAWALTLTALTGHSTAIFGHAVSAQLKHDNTTLPIIEGFVGPIIRLVPCRVHFYGSTETVAQVLERIRDDSAQDVPNQDVTLASITNLLQLPRLFNTALTVQAPVIKPQKGLGTAERPSRLEIRQIGGYDPSEFDVTINAIDDGEILNVHVIYRDQDTGRGEQAAHNLAETIRKALVSITESQDPATVQIESILHESIGIKRQKDPEDVNQHPVEIPDGDESQLELNTVSPRTEMERRLQILCAKVVGADPDTINLHNDFFSIGGDSATAMQVVAEAYRTGVAITVRQVMSSPTLTALAEVASLHPMKLASDYQPFSLVSERQRGLIVAELTSSWASDRPSTLEVYDILPTTDMQSYCIQMGLEEPSLAHNYVCFDIHPGSDICEERVEQACRSVLRHFSLLRTEFVRQDGRLWQVVLSEREILSDNRPILRKYHVGESETLEQAYNAICVEDMDKAQVGTHLGLRTATFMLFEKAEADTTAAGSRTKYKFTMRLSHAQYDGVSLPLIVRALEDAYNSADMSPIVPFGAFITQVSQQGEQSLAFWRRKLQGAKVTRILPTLVKHRRQDSQDSICASEEVLDLAGSGCKRILKTTSRELTVPPPGRQKYTSATLVAAAWALVLSSLTGRRDVVFGQVVSGRNARLPRMHEVCGPTSTILPLRVRLGGDWVARDLLRHVQEQSTGVGEFDAPLGLWREVLGELRSDDGEAVIDTTAATGERFPFEIVLLHQSTVEEEHVVCPFGKGTLAKPTLLEEQRAPPYICVKSKLETHNMESLNTTAGSTGTRSHGTRDVRQRQLLLSIEASSTKMTSETAASLMELLGEAVSALSGGSEITLAEIKSKLSSK